MGFKGFKLPKINGETLKKGARSAKLFVTRNAPELAAGAAILCMGGAVYMAVKATQKYEKELMEAEIRKNKQVVEDAVEGQTGEDKAEYQELTKKEKAVIILKCYWPVAVLAACSGTAMFASVKFSHKQLKAMTVVAAAAETALASNEKAITDILSGKDVTKVKMAANEETIAKNPPPIDPYIEKSAILGMTRFYDTMMERWFYSDINGIQNAIFEAVDEFQDVGTLSVNDLCQHYGIKTLDYGDYIVWDQDRKGRPHIWIEYTKDIKDDERYALIKYSVMPEGRFEIPY